MVQPEVARAAPNGDEPPTAEDVPVARAVRSRPKDPRHVHAVPTTAEVKVERALELFNDSDHQRTIAGLARTLGDPWVSALPDEDQAERRVPRRGLGAVLVPLPGRPRATSPSR